MSWELTMVFVHGAALVGLVMLWRRPPCWMQKLVVLILFLAMLVLLVGGFVWLAGWVEEARHLYRIGLLLEHSAVLLWIFRLIYQDRVQWTSSKHYPSS